LRLLRKKTVRWIETIKTVIEILPPLFHEFPEVKNIQMISRRSQRKEMAIRYHDFIFSLDVLASPSRVMARIPHLIEPAEIYGFADASMGLREIFSTELCLQRYTLVG
jgi:hypothetical protein